MAARKRSSFEMLIARNPKVDLGKLRAAETALRELRSRGLPVPDASVTTPIGKASLNSMSSHVSDLAGEQT